MNRRGLPRYARAGIPEFWIVDLRQRVVEVCRAPSGDGYLVTSTHHSGDRVTLAAADITITLDLVFPP